MINTKKLHSLDLLRGVLALIVCIAHSSNMYHGDAPDFLGLSARLAVLFFFALSGFVIAGSLNRNFSQNGHIDLIDFAKQRFFRVMPPLLGVLIVMIAAETALRAGGFVPAIVGQETVDYHLNLFKVGVSLLTLGAIGDLTGGLDGPLWSLRYEIRCYVTAGLLAWVLFAPRKNMIRTVCVLGFLSLYWFTGLFIRNEGLFSVQLPSLLSFVAGFACYFMCKRLPGRHSAWLALALVVIGLPFLMGPVSQIDQSWGALFAQSVCGAGFALAVRFISSIEFSAVPPIYAYLGDISYSLYILHYPLMLGAYFVIAKLCPGWLGYPIALAAFGTVLSIGVSAAFAFVFERPAAHRAWIEKKLANLALPVKSKRAA